MVGFFIYYFYFFLLFIAKIFNVGIKARGSNGNGINPRDFDNHIKYLKVNAINLLNKVKIFKQSSSLTASKKLELLTELENLNSRGKITNAEYQKLRKEIME